MGIDKYVKDYINSYDIPFGNSMPEITNQPGNGRLAPVQRNVFAVSPHQEKTLSDEQRQLLDLIS